jgi:hypothetical protein
VTATEWRNKSGDFYVGESKPVEIECCEFFINRGSPVWTYHFKNAIRQVAIEEIRPLKVAYIRNVGPYRGGEIIFGEVYTGANPNWGKSHRSLSSMDFLVL